MHIIKKSDEIILNDARTSGDFIYFNQNKFSSDTQGELKGLVYYVQNSIIPSHRNIADDIQPRIIQNRDLMILFRPDITDLDIIYLNVRDERDRIILTRTMVNDESRIPLCQQVNITSDIDFIIPENFNIVIDNNEMIKKISSDVNYFEKIISENAKIKIRTSDGNYSGKFFLRSNPNFSEKMILFSSNSGYAFEVIRPRFSTIKIFRGDSYLLVNYNGEWITENEMKYSLIRYMKNCWHTLIQAETVKPGIKFEIFTHDQTGIIDDIDIGSPNQLLLHTISIGMLTSYREDFYFQENPEYHRQYFQQIPVSQLIVSTYDPIYLKEIMLPDGRFFTDFASGEGGTHTGNMREYIAKDLISQGINYANYGYTSSKVNDNTKNMIAGQITIHTSIGKYANGIQIHGLSGGAGIATLKETLGNEFSHEIGHNYGLGHNLGGVYGSVAQIPSVRNSTWGWDSDNHFFIPNFEQVITNKTTYLDKNANDSRPTAPFKGHSLGKDAMAGGQPLYPDANAFTLHTPYVLSLIQKFFESKAIFNRASPTGFSFWNTELKKMEPYKLINDSVDFFSMTVSNGVDITASEINKYLKSSINIIIATRDGLHTKFVYLPDADQSNNGLIINFKINSTLSVNVEVNGIVERLVKGTIKNYISNGKNWEVFDSELLDANIVPYKQGVKVITLVGYYDPEKKLESYIYPALNGSYGNVYHYSRRSRCYLVIEYSSGEKFSYSLAPFRYTSNEMNKLHINIERDLMPKIIRLYIDGELVTQREITLGSDNLSYTVNGAPLL